MLLLSRPGYEKIDFFSCVFHMRPHCAHYTPPTCHACAARTTYAREPFRRVSRPFRHMAWFCFVDNSKRTTRSFKELDGQNKTKKVLYFSTVFQLPSLSRWTWNSAPLPQFHWRYLKAPSARFWFYIRAIGTRSVCI
jgi:hypothetical protein